jgi:hypothetical protein
MGRVTAAFSPGANRVVPSPARTPRYHGTCEAGIGSMKVRTLFLAARDVASALGRTTIWKRPAARPSRSGIGNRISARRRMTCGGGPPQTTNHNEHDSAQPCVGTIYNRRNSRRGENHQSDDKPFGSSSSSPPRSRRLGLLTVTGRSVIRPLRLLQTGNDWLPPASAL